MESSWQLYPYTLCGDKIHVLSGLEEKESEHGRAFVEAYPILHKNEMPCELPYS
jgi:hypothetical protein